ncbi:MAG: ABC-2 family transporter protein [Candidatus Eremiobacteraeota bacterium]|nr:ABC-2 family transporter protein [Candidatus Eremiobacteraeota bacterium]
MTARIFREFGRYGAIALINVQNSLAYGGELLLRSIFILVILYIFVHLWKATYLSAGASRIEGLSMAQTLWYLVVTESLIMSRSPFSGTISDEVKEGTLAYSMSRPLNYLLYHFAFQGGESLVRLTINLVMGGLLMTAFVGPPSLSPLYIVPFIVSLMLAFILDFCLEGLIGLMAFFTEDITGIQLIYGKILFILGGLLFPLDFFPQWLRQISLALPFNLVLYGPAKLFVDFSMARWWALTASQLCWIVLIGIALAAAFKKSLRHVAINGG